MKFHSILAAFVLANTSANAAEVPCFNHDSLEAALSRDFHEEKVAIGLAGKDYMVETYASANGTWTQTTTDTTGKSCITGAGESYQALVPAVKGDRT